MQRQRSRKPYVSLAEVQSTQRDTGYAVGRSKRKHYSADTSCPCRAEVNFTRNGVRVKISLSVNSAPLREEGLIFSRFAFDKTINNLRRYFDD